MCDENNGKKIVHAKNIEQEIHQLYLHDCLLTLMLPDIKNRNLKLEFTNYYKGYEKRYVYNFIELIYFEMTNYWRWSSISYIDALYCEKNDIVSKRFLELVKEQEAQDYEIAFNLVRKHSDQIIQPCVSFISGDVLRIVCTSIEIEEFDLK